LVDWKVDPGPTKMLIQEHVVVGEIMFTAISYRTWFYQVQHVTGSASLLILEQHSNHPIRF